MVLSDKEAKWMLYGVLALLAVKYLIIGLDGWNAVLHPGRSEPDSLNAFDRPLLGIFS